VGFFVIVVVTGRGPEEEDDLGSWASGSWASGGSGRPSCLWALSRTRGRGERDKKKKLM